MPFYLTTELEFFVVLINQDQVSSLGNAPIIVSNISTGDEYQAESDVDGYVSFNNLMLGNYQVKIDQQFLTDKGLQAEVAGFEFNSPLKGGFILLPNIELSRSESGEIGANKLLKIDLDDDNYAPILKLKTTN
ncbi:carboxypeptidase-like regulatory domain-containing protein [Paraglaciecola aquimarina]|uniref:Carboxypeptidase-like regulatory domain-containing protein n=1 Tax=Paraglaciecola aquimarina TaxID=1235557 RepID=A0ABU3SXE4_9ALTE|nr:carboxypeptidase-like regulatory domain-containing protein [Paraglaciecola aquimarina]MDU0354647.1 carboxypeptidase-like regulatory domain-containing protein [Paraglaciecola aquimarina]